MRVEEVEDPAQLGSCGYDETSVTMGAWETMRVLTHWPSLEQAYFFLDGVEPSPPFRWLLDQLRHGTQSAPVAIYP